MFYKYWNDIRNTGMLNQYFRDLKDEKEGERKRQAIMRCMELVEGLTS